MGLKCILMIMVLCSFHRLCNCNELELLHTLQANFSRIARPVLEASKPVYVTFGFELIQIVELMEEDQSIILKQWLRMSWVNELTRWSPENHHNITSVQVMAEDVWTPDLFAIEDVGEEMSEGNDNYKTKITIYHNGLHFWLVPVVVKTSCQVHVDDFPFDRQYCHLKYLSWTMDESKLVLKKDPRPIVTPDNYVVSSLLVLHDIKGEEHSQSYKCCPNNYSLIKYTLVIDRKPGYYIVHIVVPCVLQMAIILLSFGLPPGCGERVSLIITVLLVLAVYLEVLQNTLPKVSDSAPALSLFYLVSMAESVVAFIFTCIVITIHFQCSENRKVQPMPRWTRDIFLGVVARCVFVSTPLNKKQKIHPLNVDDVVEVKEKGSVCDEHGNIAEFPTPGTTTASKSVGILPDATPEHIPSPKCQCESAISGIQEQYEVEEEWGCLVIVLDRFFFVLVLFIFIFSSLVILLPLSYGTNYRKELE